MTPDGERTVGGKAAGDASGAGATDLQPDVERLHRAVLREPRNPRLRTRTCPSRSPSIATLAGKKEYGWENGRERHEP